MPTLLTIAGFDPSSGAGITADLMVFAAHGCFGISCPTALTVQSTTGVRDVIAVSPDAVTRMLECLREDLPPAGIKLGMLCNAGIVSAVADFLASAEQRGLRVPVVLDPVLRSSSGRALLEPNAVQLLRDRLLPRVDWITPNVDELAVLVGRQSFRSATAPADARAKILAGARDLQADAPKLGLVITGGHMDPPDDLLLPVGGEPEWIDGRRVETRSTHGTGCAFSSALLARLVLGDDAREAARAAKQYVRRAMELAPGLGAGNGPLNHLWTRPLK